MISLDDRMADEGVALAGALLEALAEALGAILEVAQLRHLWQHFPRIPVEFREGCEDVDLCRVLGEQARDRRRGRDAQVTVRLADHGGGAQGAEAEGRQLAEAIALAHFT